MKKLFSCLCLLLCLSFSQAQVKISVATNGNDAAAGTLTKPLKSLPTAIQKALLLKGQDVIIELRGGVYVLDETLKISADDYQLKSLTIQPYQQETVTVSSGKRLKAIWKPYKNGIFVADIKLISPPDQLFINGKVLPMARYPNEDASARVYKGTAADAISKERVKKWQNPAGGYIHALHRGEWGDFHYQIIRKEKDSLIYEGGWQNNRPSPMHKDHRFVEHIFEELDAPREWFYDKAAGKLYVYPPKGTDISKAQFSVSGLTDLLHFTGSVDKPLKNVSIRNINFTQTARSFMLAKEPLLRSDWCIYRGGAILLDGTENIQINDCKFSQIGGNAIFLSNYNKNNRITDNHIYDIGASAIAFVGSADAVRSPAFRYEQFVPWDKMDFEKGPKNSIYPQYCIAKGNLIHDIGTIEKQVAGVQISMAAHITASYNSIYSVPRSGINVSEGTWGGHIIEFNDVFKTVLETGDHGAFNSWGRDRYWRPNRRIIDSIVAARPGIELLDVIDPIIIRNNRFQCDHGWDIDLDDGSSHYEIYNNLCLSGGLKLREGYQRIVKNNILYNNTFHPHVWLKNSRDVFKNNLVMSPYAPIGMANWGNEIDANFFFSEEGLKKAQSLKQDEYSKFGNPDFVDAKAGNFQVKANSAAFETGFKNFPMVFGVTKPALKKIAESPVLSSMPMLSEEKGMQINWLGANLKNIETLGERSAAGIHDNNGALLISLTEGSLAEKSGLKPGDVIIKLGNNAIKSVNDLLKIYQSIKWTGHAKAIIVRNQGEQNMEILFK
ncbi:peptidase Do [Pedobacter glucosidilyticus]|nr:PDZ domain-containing protein [Pedobacter glucosidilyticus]KHJ39383.1 peptidase Do [Pedobacter glucosidilyticus]